MTIYERLEKIDKLKQHKRKVDQLLHQMKKKI